MTRTQTALAHWPLTDPEWFLIDPAEWQEGQEWLHSPEHFGGASVRPSVPVWVRELLPLPDPPAAWPYDKIAWLGDVPVALAGDLPPDTLVSGRACGVHLLAGAVSHDLVVFVVAWPDGTKPVKPTRRFTAERERLGTHPVEVVVRDNREWVFCSSLDSTEQAAAFVAQVNGDQA